MSPARSVVRPATQVRLKAQPCAACHKDPHRGSSRIARRVMTSEVFGERRSIVAVKFPLLESIGRSCQSCHKRAGDFAG
jgi:hypothetical protein